MPEALPEFLGTSAGWWYRLAMIKILEAAIEKLTHLPAEQQAYAAHVLEQIADNSGPPFVVLSDHRAAILEGLAQVKRGELASDDAVDALLRQPWA